MAFSGQYVTGLLGYSLRKEMLGEGFFYREIEVYNWAVYVQPNALQADTPFSSIQSGIKNAFQSRYSGDINVKVFDAPAGYTLPNDSIRLGRFDVQVEVRKPVIDLATHMPELSDNYYKGFDSSFIINNCNILNDVKEDFLFDENENGNKTYSHNLSFAIRSGTSAKSLAANIASGVFAQDKDTTFGIYAFIGGALLANDTNYRNYYTESYDLIRNTYSFSKKREILPISDSLYTYNLNHTLNFKEDGIIELQEKGNVQGKLAFAQAYQGMGDLLIGSYGRCNDVYNKFKDFSAGSSVGDSLLNFPLSTNKTLNKPLLSVEYEVNYSNNPVYTLSGTVEKIIDVNNDGRFTSIDHTYNFLAFISPVYSGVDATYIPLITGAYDESPNLISSFYAASPFYSSDYPTVNRIKMTSTTPNRHKNFIASFSYTNKPTYFITIDGYTYPFFEYSMSDTKPVDIISEYKIINRPSKTSLINYAYQTEKGNKEVQITAQLSRTSNVFSSPLPGSSVGLRMSSLYRNGLERALSTFFGLNVLALSYQLNSVKYSIDSKNEIKLNISIGYTLKKYTA